MNGPRRTTDGRVARVFRFVVAFALLSCSVASVSRAQDETPQQRLRNFVGVSTSAVPPVVSAQIGHLLDDGRGLLVTYVLPDSPAAKAGLRRYDVLVEAGGRPLAAPMDLTRVVNATDSGEELEIAVVRGAKPSRRTVQVAQRPAARTRDVASYQRAAQQVANSVRVGGKPLVSPLSGEIRDRSVLLQTDDNRFEATVSEDGETARWQGPLEKEPQVPEDVSQSAGDDVSRLLEAAKAERKRGGVLRVRIQPRSDGERTGVTIRVTRRTQDAGLRLFEIERVVEDGDRLPVDELLQDDAFAGELEQLSPKVRERVVESLRRFRIPKVRVDVRNLQ